MESQPPAGSEGDCNFTGEYFFFQFLPVMDITTGTSCWTAAAAHAKRRRERHRSQSDQDSGYSHVTSTQPNKTLHEMFCAHKPTHTIDNSNDPVFPTEQQLHSRPLTFSCVMQMRPCRCVRAFADNSQSCVSMLTVKDFSQKIEKLQLHFVEGKTRKTSIKSRLFYYFKVWVKLNLKLKHYFKEAFQVYGSCCSRKWLQHRWRSLSLWIHEYAWKQVNSLTRTCTHIHLKECKDTKSKTADVKSPLRTRMKQKVSHTHGCALIPDYNGKQMLSCRRC